MSANHDNLWRVAVDRGGTFTDIVAVSPDGQLKALKLLSSTPEYKDASVEGVRRILMESGVPLSSNNVEALRFGTTVATNALLERKGGRVLLITNSGFGDLLEIGPQTRPDIFSLNIKKNPPLYSDVLEVNGRIGPDGSIETPFDEDGLSNALDKLDMNNFDAVAVLFLHSWINPEHELLCAEALKGRGDIKSIYLSHRSSNMIKAVPRGQSTVLDAYLSPVVDTYLSEVLGGCADVPFSVMTSAGRLSRRGEFTGKDMVLSGPAGGVVAVNGTYEAISRRDNSLVGAVGFDMGGTSTDVCRVDSDGLDRVSEREVAGVELQSESLDIVTVAAGGGSILSFDSGRMIVGPESAGAEPGPACYGFGGPLTVTDANMITGRIVPEYFPHVFGPERNAPLDGQASAKLFREKLQVLRDEFSFPPESIEEFALGYLRIANEKMAQAIKEVSVSKGFDVRNYALVCFGGAAGQHACQIAELLGIEKIIVHPLASLLSAYGIGLAKRSLKAEQTVLMPLEAAKEGVFKGIFSELSGCLMYESLDAEIIYEMDLRPKGADSSLRVAFDDVASTTQEFKDRYQRHFGFSPSEVVIEVVNLRVEVLMKEPGEFPVHDDMYKPEVDEKLSDLTRTVYFDDGAYECRVYDRGSIRSGDTVQGPSIIADPFTTVVVEPGFTASVLEDGMLLLEKKFKEKAGKVKNEGSDRNDSPPEPVLLEVFNNTFSGIATEMGHALKNTAFSVNIKERLDFSCALFDPEGDLVVNAPHIPVHLGSMGDTVKAVIERFGDSMRPGDMYLTNNPFRGGSHLPDMTVVSPVFDSTGTERLFYTAARGHHADIGGTTPGSMPPESRHIDEEGVLIDGMLISRGGTFMQEDVLNTLKGARYPARNIDERISDLKAQAASCARGEHELLRVISRYGWKTVKRYMAHIQDNAAMAVREALWELASGEDSFKGSFSDHMDDGTKIAVSISVVPGSSPPSTLKAIIDFGGTGDEHEGDNLNAPESVTRSAVLYVLRTLIGRDIPLNGGCLRPVKIVIPEGSLLSPKYPRAVASGNVETSQRVVDVLLGAFKKAAASQGTMNNILFQVEGEHPYYETIAGGAGATAESKGASAVQVHMTNTRITDPEVLETRHPGVRLDEFSIRRNSGGAGRNPGGDGVVRALRFLKRASVSVLSERRSRSPYGLSGGKEGKKGINLKRSKDGKTDVLSHRAGLELEPGESIIIKTPGGGGFGET